MRALGITCGVGSLLIGARDAGFDIVGNIEHRPYYHTGTFEHNFKAPMVRNIGEFGPDRIEHIDLVMGHPDCGNFSNLTTRRTATKMDDPLDIPLFAGMVKKVNPRFFVMDNLPKSLTAFTILQWAEILSDYDLFPEWVSNYGYGNTQKFRNRFFMVGAKREEGFVFIPGESQHDRVLNDVIEDLPLDEDIPGINHVHVRDEEILHEWFGFYINRPELDRVTVAQFKEYIRNLPTGASFPYTNRQGEVKRRIGVTKVALRRPSLVVLGGGFTGDDNHYREDTLRPLTQRERARIQGCPDDFIFLPLDYRKSKQSNTYVYKSIGKFMPVEFGRYIAHQISDHIKGEPFECSGNRLIRPNEHIDAAKKWYCANVGYGNSQDRACESCWIRPCSMSSKLGIEREPLPYSE